MKPMAANPPTCAAPAPALSAPDAEELPDLHTDGACPDCPPCPRCYDIINGEASGMPGSDCAVCDGAGYVECATGHAPGVR